MLLFQSIGIPVYIPLLLHEETDLSDGKPWRLSWVSQGEENF